MGVPPHFRDFGNIFPRLCQFWSKTKMVRLVDTNNFRGIGLEICGGKDELWTKSKKNWRGGKIQNSVLRPREGF